MICRLAPETNGEVAVKAWEALGEADRAASTRISRPRATTTRSASATCRRNLERSFRHRPGVGLESEHVSYNAGYTNVHELIPWRTLTGRQQFYQDHLWMLAFGEALVTWRPPIDTKTIAPMQGSTATAIPRSR